MSDPKILGDFELKEISIVRNPPKGCDFAVAGTIKEPKLIVVYIVEKDEDLFKLSYESIKDVADAVIIIDGNKEKSYRYSDAPNDIICNVPYPHNDKGANGKQRNEYIKILKERFIGDYCLVLDADEVVDYPKKIKEVINHMETQKVNCVNIHMRHFVGSLGQEDNTVDKHFVPTRLFKITPDIYYDEEEHVVLKSKKEMMVAPIEDFCIYHFGYSREIFTLLKKYKNHCEKSNIHTSEFLTEWYHSHLTGKFPTKEVDITTLPKIIKDHFQINDDYLYFKDRNIELKHGAMVHQWYKHFKPEQVLDVGCGRGPYLHYWEDLVDCSGFELSKWAINHKFCDAPIYDVDISKEIKKCKYDLVTTLDILEHLDYEELPITLKNIYGLGYNDFLFSIPFEYEDPNLHNDPTHKIFKPRLWWYRKLEEAGFKIKETPKHWLFHSQMVVCEK